MESLDDIHSHCHRHSQLSGHQLQQIFTINPTVDWITEMKLDESPQSWTTPIDMAMSMF